MGSPENYCELVHTNFSRQQEIKPSQYSRKNKTAYVTLVTTTFPEMPPETIFDQPNQAYINSPPTPPMIVLKLSSI